MPRITDQDPPPQSSARDRRGRTVRGSAGTHHRADLRAAARGQGAYLTDGLRLFRNVSPLRGTVGAGLVALEECRSLQLVLMPVREFARLRDVRAAR